MPVMLMGLSGMSAECCRVIAVGSFGGLGVEMSQQPTVSGRSSPERTWGEFASNAASNHPTAA
jgi:hypothetical protein